MYRRGEARTTSMTHIAVRGRASRWGYFLPRCLYGSRVQMCSLLQRRSYILFIRNSISKIVGSETAIPLTRVKMKVGQMQDLQSLSTGLLGKREGVWFGLRKPPGHIERRGRRHRARAIEEVLADHLPIQAGYVREGEDLGDSRASTERTIRSRTVTREVEGVAEGLGDRWTLLWCREHEHFGDAERGLTLSACVVDEWRIGRLWVSDVVDLRGSLRKERVR